MKTTRILMAATLLPLVTQADVIVTYGTAGSTTSLAANYNTPEVTPANLTAGTGLTEQNFTTFNFVDWDPANTDFASAVAADDKWTWGFTVNSNSIDLTTMDIRLDRSGTGPDDIEIQAVATVSGVAQPAVTILTHDYVDSDSSVDFLDVDLSALPELAVGDSVEFTLAAFNSESSDGTFDLETVADSNGIIINGTVVGGTPKLAIDLFEKSAAFEWEAGEPVFFAEVTRDGDTTDALTVTVTNPDTTELLVPATVEFAAGESAAYLEFEAVDDTDTDGAQVVTLELSATGYLGTTADVTIFDDDTATPDVVLNEALINTTGTDTEFFELYNNSGATVDIQGWSVATYNGLTGELETTVEIPTGTAVDLAPNGFYLIGDTAFETAYAITPDLSVPSIGTGSASQTVVVFDAAGNIVSNALLLAGDGGYATIMGAVILTPDVEAGPDGSYLIPGFRYVADGGGYAEALEFSPTPAPSATPGYSNALTPELALELNNDFIAEDAGTAAATATVTRSYAEPTLALTVTLTEDDADDSEISIPASVIIPAGETSVTFDIDALTDGIVDGVQNITITATDGGGTYTAGTATIGVTDIDAPQFTDVVINEFDADQTSADTAEFIELYNTSSSSGSLDNLVLVMFNGNGDASYLTIDLTGYTIPANGYFVTGYASTVANVDLDFVADLGFSTDGVLQNGPDAIALFVGSSADFPYGTTVTDALSNPNVTLLDAVVYDTDEADDTGLLTAFGLTEQINENENGNKDTESGSRFPDGSGAFGMTTPTPGAANAALPVETEDGYLVITDFSADFGTNEVAVTIDGLQSGITYSLESSTDLGESDPWTTITTFSIGDSNLVQTGADIYTLTVTDADLATESANFYRASGE